MKNYKVSRRLKRLFVRDNVSEECEAFNRRVEEAWNDPQGKNVCGEWESMNGAARLRIWTKLSDKERAKLWTLLESRYQKELSESEWKPHSLFKRLFKERLPPYNWNFNKLGKVSLVIGVSAALVSCIFSITFTIPILIVSILALITIASL